MLVEGDKGSLTFQGTRYLSFLRDARNTGDLIKKKRTERSLHAIIEEKIRRNLWKT